MRQTNAVPDPIYTAVTEKLPETKLPKADKASFSRTLLHVAWMAILLGLIVETLILIVAASFGSVLAAKPFLADLTQKVSWSVIVCMGLALARGATRLFAATAQTVLVGAAGLLTAPAAFAVARSLHEGVQEALFIKVFQGGAGSPVLLALIKGVEYGCLGALLMWIGKQVWGKALAHAGAGLVIGIVFGAVLIGAMAWGMASPMSVGTIISRALNEIINPVGCSLTLYSAEILGRSQVAAGDLDD
ncbi:MAG: hypothetical protein SF097_23400 [Acidobacteriota bacterium]|nr:hypothetical protein [Acidobacteriota bacterium]